MHIKNKKSIFSALITLCMLVLLAFPSAVFAEDGQPAEGEPSLTGEAPADPEADLPEPQVTVAAEEEAPSEEGGTAAEETPEAEETPAGESEADLPDPQVTVAAEEEAPSEEGGAAADETPEAEGTPAGEPEAGLPEPQATVVEEEDLSEVVEKMSEAELILVDEEGQAVPLASQEAVEALFSSDPWFIGEDGKTHRFYPSGTTLPYDCDNVNIFCEVSDTPIQAAINEAHEGAEIHIESGNYAEQISIGKSLTLIGPEEGEAVITYPDDVVYSVSFDENSKLWEPIVWVDGGLNTIVVNIIGLTIDGANRPPSSGKRAAGILLRNVGEVIEEDEFEGIVYGNTVRNMHQDGAETFGIAVYGDSALNIVENEVSGFSRGGISANGDRGGLPDPKVIIYGNTVSGPGDGTWAPNGIQIGWGATGMIIGNDVSGNIYPGEDWTGSGIIVASSNDVVIADNIVKHNQTGIAVVGYLPDEPAENNVIYNNQVTENYWGISIQDYAVNTWILENTITGNLYDGIDVMEFNDVEPEGTTIEGNLIYGNDPEGECDDCGGLWTNLTTNTIDALYNYWGCDDGPGATGCDTTTGAVDYEPWLIDRDGDWVFEASDGNPAYVDNCPNVYNPGQKDSDGDGVGNACDPTPFGPPAEEPAAPVGQPVIPVEVIPVASDEPLALSCEAIITLELPSEHQVIFNQLMCGYEAALVEETPDSLPGELPEGYTFIAGLTLELFRGGAQIEELEDGTLQVSFVLPEEVEGELVILYWDAEAGEWVEITDFVIVEGRVVLTVNYPGTFVLAIK